MKDPQFAKLIVFINSLVPLAMVIWDVAAGTAGANPTEYALHTTGLLAIIFLFLSLTITPLRLITGANWLSHFRRMLGLFAFFYGSVHLVVYFIFYQSGSLAGVIKETGERPFILFGMSALLLMLPLAITSTNGMIKRLGGKNWKRLHWLVYACAILGMLHYWNASKLIGSQQKVFAGVLAMLLGYRVVRVLGKQAKNRRQGLEAPATRATEAASDPR